MSINDQFCTKNKELCIKNQEFCIKNDEFCSTVVNDAIIDLVMRRDPFKHNITGLVRLLADFGQKPRRVLVAEKCVWALRLLVTEAWYVHTHAGAGAGAGAGARAGARAGAGAGALESSTA